ncbi:GLPGLI family protein [Pseudopedobacter beijingensis]|uniref:GLPGLI family protein n=1 Tax=Pseudopedobacter beijingensis TaxID=1207056 RepID=A0ABW4I814_9SPHI
MKKPHIIFILLMLLCCNIFAQHSRFATQGEIQFEKKINMHAMFRMSMNKNNEVYLQKMFDEYKSKHPQFVTLKSTLLFSNQTTFFKPIKDEDNSLAFVRNSPGVEQINIIQTDLKNKTSIIQKSIFEEVYLVKDSFRKINWKITSETREIAGYPCRRANAVIMDSIYVVAFYTDKIPVSGGPESFTGLPGMILGVALPHEHMTWFATSVKDMPVASSSFQMPAKGKSIDNKTLQTTLENVFKQWGTVATRYLRFYLM